MSVTAEVDISDALMCTINSISLLLLVEAELILCTVGYFNDIIVHHIFTPITEEVK